MVCTAAMPHVLITSMPTTFIAVAMPTPRTSTLTSVISRQDGEQDAGTKAAAMVDSPSRAVGAVW